MMPKIVQPQAPYASPTHTKSAPVELSSAREHAKSDALNTPDETSAPRPQLRAEAAPPNPMAPEAFVESLPSVTYAVLEAFRDGLAAKAGR